MKNPIENNEASHNYVIGANVGGIYAENFTLYLNGNNNNYLTEIYDKLTYSNRAKVLSLIETLLEEQESQT